MKFISKLTVYSSTVERYDLDHLFSEKPDNKGLIICYLLTQHHDVTLESLELEPKHEEIGVPEKWYKRYTNSSFYEKMTSLPHFLSIYDDNDFGGWTMDIIYQSEHVSISGRRTEAEIGASYAKTSEVDLLNLFSDVETKSYEYNSYPKELLLHLMTDYKFSTKQAVLSIKKLLRHKDIYDEFLRVVTSSTPAIVDGEILVEGYTADQLNDNYPLSLLGAYHYLIYLRESPSEALEELKKGLPLR